MIVLWMQCKTIVENVLGIIAVGAMFRQVISAGKNQKLDIFLVIDFWRKKKVEKVNGTEKVERARNWTLIFYPDEGIKDFKKVLDELCVPCCVSPLHTPEDKKAHHHILFSGDKKTESQIYNEICKRLGDVVILDGKETVKGVTKPQRVVNLRSTVRYFLHLDNPKKQQFENKVLEDYGGFDSSKYLISKSDVDAEKYASIKYVIKIIKQKKFCSILDLLDYLGDVDDALFKVCCDNAYLCTQLTNVYKLERKKEKTTLQIVNSVL